MSGKVDEENISHKIEIYDLLNDNWKVISIKDN